MPVQPLGLQALLKSLCLAACPSEKTMRYECFLDSECFLDWILYISMTQFQVEHCNEAESLVAGIEACAGKGEPL